MATQAAMRAMSKTMVMMPAIAPAGSAPPSLSRARMSSLPDVKPGDRGGAAGVLCGKSCVASGGGGSFNTEDGGWLTGERGGEESGWMVTGEIRNDGARGGVAAVGAVVGAFGRRSASGCCGGSSLIDGEMAPSGGYTSSGLGDERGERIGSSDGDGEREGGVSGEDGPIVVIGGGVCGAGIGGGGRSDGVGVSAGDAGVSAGGTGGEGSSWAVGKDCAGASNGGREGGESGVGSSGGGEGGTSGRSGGGGGVRLGSGLRGEIRGGGGKGGARGGGGGGTNGGAKGNALHGRIGGANGGESGGGGKR
mmetsp:Transcript_38937/g.85585  ORF Transcript_38937/g.85585 Transcript_38937/m.85585 type:complete len:307 (-) Transcript_38937:693-1613(-)